MTVCSNLIAEINNDPSVLAKMTVKQLTTTKGLGEVKAITLIAATELVKRMTSATAPLCLKLDKAVELFLRPYFSTGENIQYHLVLMNSRNELLATSELPITENELPSLKVIIKLCLDSGAAIIMLCRNEVKLTEAYLNREKAFVIQLDAAACMLKIKMRGLLVIE